MHVPTSDNPDRKAEKKRLQDEQKKDGAKKADPKKA